jgi:hypothetical protein
MIDPLRSSWEVFFYSFPKVVVGEFRLSFLLMSPGCSFRVVKCKTMALVVVEYRWYGCVLFVVVVDVDEQTTQL